MYVLYVYFVFMQICEHTQGDHGSTLGVAPQAAFTLYFLKTNVSVHQILVSNWPEFAY